MLFQIQSFLIVMLLIYGAYYITSRPSGPQVRKRHLQIMGFALIWDLILILQIELSRSAIATAAGPLQNPLLLNIHIGFAISTVLIYALIVISGVKLLKIYTSGSSNSSLAQQKFRHRILGIIALTLRVMTLITSFFAV